MYNKPCRSHYISATTHITVRRGLHGVTDQIIIVLHHIYLHLILHSVTGTTLTKHVNSNIMSNTETINSMSFDIYFNIYMF